jgi:hypothetical protein
VGVVAPKNFKHQISKSKENSNFKPGRERRAWPAGILRRQKPQIAIDTLINLCHFRGDGRRRPKGQSIKAEGQKGRVINGRQRGFCPGANRLPGGPVRQRGCAGRMDLCHPRDL